SPKPKARLNARAQVPTVTPMRVRIVRTFCRQSPPRAKRTSSRAFIGDRGCRVSGKTSAGRTPLVARITAGFHPVYPIPDSTDIPENAVCTVGGAQRPLQFPSFAPHHAGRVAGRGRSEPLNPPPPPTTR